MSKLDSDYDRLCEKKCSGPISHKDCANMTSLKLIIKALQALPTGSDCTEKENIAPTVFFCAGTERTALTTAYRTQ